MVARCITDFVIIHPFSFLTGYMILSPLSPFPFLYPPPPTPPPSLLSLPLFFPPPLPLLLPSPPPRIKEIGLIECGKITSSSWDAMGNRPSKEDEDDSGEFLEGPSQVRKWPFRLTGSFRLVVTVAMRVRVVAV